MTQSEYRQFPVRNLGYLLIWGGAIAALVILAIYPNHKSLARKASEIERLKAEISEQEVLLPLFEDIKKGVAKEKKPALPLPRKSGLGRYRIENLAGVLEKMAHKSHVKLNRVIPNVGPLAGTSNLLSVSCLISGGFFAFRNFLVELGQMPYLKEIQEIQISSAGEECDMRIIFRLELKQ
jgi:hypothetical protein